MIPSQPLGSHLKPGLILGRGRIWRKGSGGECWLYSNWNAQRTGHHRAAGHGNIRVAVDVGADCRRCNCHSRALWSQSRSSTWPMLRTRNLQKREKVECQKRQQDGQATVLHLCRSVCGTWKRRCPRERCAMPARKLRPDCLLIAGCCGCILVQAPLCVFFVWWFGFRGVESVLLLRVGW